MIINNTSTAVETSSNTTSTEMKVETNAVILQMLSRNVYVDPIAAVIREWSTNAIDACKMGNLPIKFEAHIPTPTESYFHVRDYGIGLSHENVLTLFTTIGASNKRDSNEYNGALGIGRLAGLAYSDSAFTIESFYNGEHNTYAMSRIGQGIEIIHLSTASTDEPNGLKLSVPVEVDDINIFTQTAQKLYKYFSHKPVINLDMNITRDTSEDLAEDWFYDNSLLAYGSNYVLMSDVRYLIPNDNSINTQGLTNHVIKMPTGSVTFNPGRESLSLSPDNITILNTKFKEIIDTYSDKIIAKVSKETDNIRKVEIFDKAIEKLPYVIKRRIRDQVSIACLDPTWRNMLKKGKQIILNKLFQHLGITTINVSHKNIHYTRPIKAHIKEAKSLLHDPYLIIDKKTNYQFIIADLSPGTIVLKREQGADLEVFKKECQILLKEIDPTSEILYASSFPEPAKKSKAKNLEGLQVRNLLKGGVFGGARNLDILDDSTDRYYYIPLSNTTPILISKYKDSLETLTDLYQRYCLLTNTPFPIVYGIPKKYMKYIENDDRFVAWEPEAVTTLDNYHFTLWDPSLRHYHRYASLSSKNPDIQKFIGQVTAYNNEKYPNSYISYQRLLDRYQLDYSTVIISDKIHTGYPLISTLAKEGKEIITEYLKKEDTIYELTHNTK